MRTTGRHASIRNPESRLPNGFTLVEMLTVIGIIVLLVSILLPVVSAVRAKGAAANTQALLQRIGSGIQSYYGDFNAYPGPLHNAQIRGTGQSLTKKVGGNVNLAESTMSENLVLGLLGGLYNDGSGIKYDPELIGQGPMGLNPRNPKKYRAYMDKINLPPWDSQAKAYKPYQDEVTKAEDTEVPEFLDGFPDGMPILYLRAKQGAPIKSGTASVVATNTTNYAEQGQYDVNQIIGYTKNNIGVGKDRDVAREYRPALSTPPPPLFHGLKTADPSKTVYESNPPAGHQGTYTYPYDLNAYLRHPTMANSVKQKDGYLLISAGADRIYGTKDDIQFPAGR